MMPQDDSSKAAPGQRGRQRGHPFPEPIRISALIRKRVNAGVLNRKISSNRVNVRGLPILFIGPPINFKVGKTDFPQISYESIYDILIIHKLLAFYECNPTHC
jgi:hypothetical protein